MAAVKCYSKPFLQTELIVEVYEVAVLSASELVSQWLFILDSMIQLIVMRFLKIFDHWTA